MDGKCNDFVLEMLSSTGFYHWGRCQHLMNISAQIAVIWMLGSLLCACADSPRQSEQLRDSLVADATSADSSRAEDDGAVLDTAVSDAGIPDAMHAADAALPPCDPPLSLTGSRSFAASYDLITFTGGGGTGNYRYRLSNNVSGAILNELTGAYLAGPVQGVNDTVELTDTQCLGGTELNVFVVEGLQIRPHEIEIGTGRSFRFDPVGGSGQFRYHFVSNTTGATLSEDGLYEAGDTPGFDVVGVVDPNSGVAGEATINVVVDPQFSVTPGRLFLPLNSEFNLQFSGGSGHVDVEADSAIVSYDRDAQKVVGLLPGRITLRINDTYAQIGTTLTVDVTASLQAPLDRVGLDQNVTVLVGPGDLNGDGFADGVFGLSQGSAATRLDGIVSIHLGGPDGLSDEPALLLNGLSRDAFFGRSVTLGDTDGDGILDLVVGSPGDDTGATNSGSIFVYRGIEGALFETEPMNVLPGLRGSDQLGTAVAVCDVNGDGFGDLIGSAILTEQRFRDDTLRDQGAILVFLGSPEGLAEAPTEILDGFHFDDEGQWVPAHGLRLGLAMAAGDFDGDGLCDIAATSLNHPHPTTDRNDGMIQVFAGRAPVDDPEYPDPGGLGPVPVQIIVADEEEVRDSALGRRMVAGDLNGDGLDDLILGQHGYDVSGDNRGAIKVFSGGSFNGPVQAYTSASEADWSWSGNSGNDALGINLAMGDFDQDGVLDLLVSAWADESEADDAINGTGAVHVLLGRRDEWPDSTPVLTAVGIQAGERFGEAVTLLGDTDGDGDSNLLVMASRTNDLGIILGRPYEVSGDDGSLRPMNLPGQAAGHRFGRSVSLVQIEAGEPPAVLVGSPNSARLPTHTTAGETWLFTHDNVDESGSMTPFQLSGLPDHNRGDLFGSSVGSGDFDGDGTVDLVTISAGEERPNGLMDEYRPDGACERVSGAGAAYIYSSDGVRTPDAKPWAIFYNHVPNAGLRLLATVDVNGDGRDDFVFGGPSADNPGDAGLIQVVLGRPKLAEGRTRLICDPVLTLYGETTRGSLGFAGTGLGDLNGDGCQEFAVGEHRGQVHGAVDSGVVRVILGWGGQGCPATPSATTLAVGLPGVNFGRGLGFLESQNGWPSRLVVGSPLGRRQDNNQRVGLVYLIDTDWLITRPQFAASNMAAPPTIIDEMTPMLILNGHGTDGRFGTSIAASRDVLAIGSPEYMWPDRVRAGAVWVYQFGGQAATLRGQVVGEVGRPLSQFGLSLSLLGTPLKLVVGAAQGSGIPTEAGAAYLFDMTALSP